MTDALPFHCRLTLTKQNKQHPRNKVPLKQTTHIAKTPSADVGLYLWKNKEFI